MIEEHKQGGTDIDRCHHRYDGAGDAGNTRHASQNNQCDKKSHYQANQPAMIFQLRIQVAEAINHRIGLHHITYAEGGDQCKAGKKYRRALHVQAVQQRIHRATGHYAVLIKLSEF